MPEKLSRGRRKQGSNRRVRKTLTIDPVVWERITELTNKADGNERASNSRWIENACLLRMNAKTESE